MQGKCLICGHRYKLVKGIPEPVFCAVHLGILTETQKEWAILQSKNICPGCKGKKLRDEPSYGPDDTGEVKLLGQVKKTCGQCKGTGFFKNGSA